MENGNRMELFGITSNGDKKKSYWTKIGVAFPNKDGSYNLRFDFLPTDPNTTIQMRAPKARKEDDSNA